MTTCVNFCMNCLRDMGVAGDCPHCGAAGGQTWWEKPVPKPGSVLNDLYLVGAVLQQDAQGITCLALRLDRIKRVALKMLWPTRTKVLEESADYLLGHPLRGHPHLAWPKDYFLEEGNLFLAYDYFEETLESKLRAVTRGRIDANDAIQLLTPVFDAVEALHGANLLHGNISPFSIQFSNRKPMLLFDGGLANLASPELASRPYIAPEQCRGVGVPGPWTDVHACASVLYRCATGMDPTSVRDRLDGARLTPPSKVPGTRLSRTAERAILWGLEPRPEQRPDSMQAFRQALQKTRGGRRAPAFPNRRRMALFAFIVLLAVSLLGLSILGVVANWQQQRAYTAYPVASAPVPSVAPSSLDKDGRDTHMPPAETTGTTDAFYPSTESRTVPHAMAAQDDESVKTSETGREVDEALLPPLLTPEPVVTEDTARDKDAPTEATPQQEPEERTSPFADAALDRHEASERPVDRESMFSGDVMDLVENEHIEIDPRGAGMDSVVVRTRRLAERPVRVHIPAGVFFISRNAAARNMVAVGVNESTLTDEDWVDIPVKAAAAARAPLIPQKDTTFAMEARPRQEELAVLAAALARANVAFPTAQAAVWIVAEDVDYEALKSPPPDAEQGALVIGPEDAARALRFCMDSGIEINNKRIWGDLGAILEEIEDESLAQWLEGWF